MSDHAVIVNVDLPGRAYAIHIGPGLLERAGELLRARSDARRATVVTDTNVGPLYANKLNDSLAQAGFDPVLVVVPAGDESKSLQNAAFIYDRLAEAQSDRYEPVVALGGGMVGDLAGFVAATWLRGVPFMQCPTTMEADVDASVGGKTAVNHPGGKNLIGCFHQPTLACIDITCLDTLSGRDFAAGLAESVKHAVIRDRAFFDWHESHRDEIRGREPEIVQELIERNCRNKAAVVVADERETAVADVGRAMLNFGHTIGHALEAQWNYALRHGETVALGMVAAMDLAVRLAGFAEDERRCVEALLTALDLPIRAPLSIDIPDTLRRLGADKKVRDRTVRFAVPTALGSVRWLDGPPVEDIERAVRRLLTP